MFKKFACIRLHSTMRSLYYVIPCCSCMFVSIYTHPVFLWSVQVTVVWNDFSIKYHSSVTSKRYCHFRWITVYFLQCLWKIYFCADSLTSRKGTNLIAAKFKHVEYKLGTDSFRLTKNTKHVHASIKYMYASKKNIVQKLMRNDYEMLCFNMA